MWKSGSNKRRSEVRGGYVGEEAGFFLELIYIYIYMHFNLNNFLSLYKLSTLAS